MFSHCLIREWIFSSLLRDSSCNRFVIGLSLCMCDLGLVVLKSCEICYGFWTVFDCPEVTLCGGWDVKMQLLTISPCLAWWDFANAAFSCPLFGVQCLLQYFNISLSKRDEWNFCKTLHNERTKSSPWQITRSSSSLSFEVFFVVGLGCSHLSYYILSSTALRRCIGIISSNLPNHFVICRL